MIFKLSTSNIESLLTFPETGMGYQIVDAIGPDYTKGPFLVLNGKLAIETRASVYPNILNVLLKEGWSKVFSSAKEIQLNITKVLGDEKRVGSFTMEGGAGKNQSAKEGKKENANGDELFVRLSAFEDDIRIDKINRRLRPGSYTTTSSDALKCKIENDNPIQRYALPNELKIEYAFYIQPSMADSLQRGWVQGNFEREGGGREVYFENGTSNRTFIAQSKWEHEYNTATK